MGAVSVVTKDELHPRGYLPQIWYIVVKVGLVYNFILVFINALWHLAEIDSYEDMLGAIHNLF